MISKGNFSSYDAFTLDNGVLSVTVMTYGATVTSLRYKGRETVLNYPSADMYESDTCYICVIAGRYANRIGGASFTLDGKKYALTKNEGENQLHGGINAFSKQVWKGEIEGDSIVMSLMSPDGDNGFPGNLLSKVRYSLDGASLNIVFEGETDAPTVYAPTFHPYFNLDGTDDVRSYAMRLDASAVLDVDAGLIPTGRRLPPEGRFDFSSERVIGGDLDHCFVLKEDGICRVEAKGMNLEVKTDCPALQVYTGSSLCGIFGVNTGIAIEPEFFPDSPNHEDFPSTVLRPGEHFKKTVSYTFSD